MENYLTRSSWLFAAAVCVLGGCGDGSGEPDAGPDAVDSGTDEDSGRAPDAAIAVDTGPMVQDSGPSVGDAGLSDAGAADAGAADAGATDAGPPGPCVPVAERLLSDPAVGTGSASITANGSDFGVVAPGERFGLWRLDASGATIGGLHPLAGSSPFYPRIAASGSGYGVVHFDLGTTVVWFIRVDTSGDMVGPPVELGAGQDPRIVWSGSEYGVVYRGLAGVYFQRVGADGALIGSAIAVTPPMTGGLVPDIAWNGTRYGVSWLAGFPNRVNVAILDPDGTVISGPTAVGEMSWSPQFIAGGPDGFAIAHRLHVVANTEVLRIDSSGAPLAPLALAGVPRAMIWNGSAYALVQGAGTGPEGESGELDLFTFGATGLASSPTSITDSPTARNSDIAFNRDSYGVVFNDSRARPNRAYVTILCPP